MTVRLVASDLDGTLFGPDHLPEQRTVDAVNAVVDAGMVFAAVTGRSYFGGAERVTTTGATAHWFIGSNGGHRLNVATNELEERLLFTSTDLDAIQGSLHDALPGVGFGFEHAAGFSYDAAFVTAFPTAFDGGPRVDSATFASNDVGKIFVTHPDLANMELLAAALPIIPSEIHATTSGISFIEFTPAGADKGAALARLCDKLDIAADEVIAFGDNENDLTMLEWAGRSVAMANGTDNVRATADEVTASNVDYGVALVLEDLLRK